MRKNKRLDNQADAFSFACYNAVHASTNPITIRAVASHLRVPLQGSVVRRELNLLCKQRALSKVKVSGVWHYFVERNEGEGERDEGIAP